MRVVGMRVGVAKVRSKTCAPPSIEKKSQAVCQEKGISRKKGKKPKEQSVSEKKSLPGQDVDLFFHEQENFAEISDLGVGEGGDNEGDDEDGDNHENFLEAMAALDGKKKRVTANRGSSQEPLDENALPAGKVELAALLKSLDGDTRKMARRIKGKKALTVPLEKPALERVTRGAGYTRVRQEVGVWDAVVHSRRAADTLHFPLNRPDMRLETAAEVVKSRFTSSTPLEQQVAALLAGSQAVVQPGQELSQLEIKCLEGLTPREIAERKAELAKFRALQTYQEAKMRRQNKIKSKKFRKIARKEKAKEKLQQLEQLAHNDPEAAAEQLEQLERRRIEERASLKHRNASRFLQEQAKRAKTTKDKDIQAIVSEQLAKHRELMTKARVVSSDSEAEEEEETAAGVNVDPSHLSQLLAQDDESYGEFSAKYRAFHQHQQDKVETARKASSAALEEEEGGGIHDLFEEAEYNLKQNILQRLAKSRDALEGTLGTEAEEEDEKVEELEDLAHAESLQFPPGTAQKPAKVAAVKRTVDAADVNPDDFMTVETKKLRSDLPKIIGYNEEEENSADEEDGDNDDEQRKAIAEAFADDDVMADFQKEKADIIAASKPKDIDLTLPGWGEWGGGGLKPSKRKRRRFIIKAPPPEKRRDENKGNLILNLDEDEKIRAHKVSTVPFPFTSVSDFEASIRAPVGDTFLPRTAFLKMIQPKVKTKMGEIIPPMDKSQLVKRGIQPLAT